MTEQRFTGGIGCFEVLEHLSDYVDGEAAPELVEKIENHLRGCDTCEKFGGEFSSVVKSLRERLVDDREVSTGVMGRLKERLGIE